MRLTTQELHSRLFSTLFVCVAIGIHLQGLATDLNYWRWRGGLPFADNPKSLCYGGGRFVVVTAGGTIFTSPDGQKWDEGVRVTGDSLNKVVYAAGQYMAVGNNGVIFGSSDGQNWTQRTSGATNNWLGLAYGNGLYIASGSAGRLALSTDGTNWAPGAVGTNDLTWITYGTGVFVVPAPNLSDLQAAVFVSNHGTSWSLVGLPPADGNVYPSQLAGVKEVNGQLVAAAFGAMGPRFGLERIMRLFTSTDGTHWEVGASTAGYPEARPDCLRVLAEANGYCIQCYVPRQDVLLTNVVAYLTHDTLSLQPVSLPPESCDSVDIAFGKGRYVMVAAAGRVWTATDLQSTWSPVHSPWRNQLRSVAFGKGLCVTAGDRVLACAPEDFASPLTSAPGVTQSFFGVACDETTFVAVGDGGALRTSTNGVDWTARNANTTQKLTAVTRGPTAWVAVGENGTIISSPSALAWTQRSSGTGHHLYSVVYGNGRYVAVGANGTILASSDAALWEVQPIDTLSQLSGVTFGNGQFVTVGYSYSWVPSFETSIIATSPDGLTWSVLPSSWPCALTSIACHQGRFLASGFDILLLNNNYLLESTNAVNWQDISLHAPTGRHVAAIAAASGAFWLAGESGMLLQSYVPKPQLDAVFLSPGQIRLTIHGLPSQALRIQTCANLLEGSWSDLLTLTNTASGVVGFDADSSSFPSRFYRAVAVQND